jgi:predicted nucleic acid-binding protein
MRTVFADAGYWIALLIPNDELRERAESAARQLDPYRVVTTEMVLVEVLTMGRSFRVPV